MKGLEGRWMPVFEKTAMEADGMFYYDINMKISQTIAAQEHLESVLKRLDINGYYVMPKIAPAIELTKNFVS